MIKLFSIFKTGFITIFTSPFWLAYFLFKMIYCLLNYIIILFKSIILFFKGKPVFSTREDRAIELMRQQDQQELESRRNEALKNADTL